MEDNLLFSMLDADFPVPSRVQHGLIYSYASRNGYKVGFYGAEDPEFSASNTYLYSKLPQLSLKYSGIIFFSLNQIGLQPLKFISDILNQRLSVHFAIQEISIQSTLQLNTSALQLLSAATSFQNALILRRALCREAPLGKH